MINIIINPCAIISHPCLILFPFKSIENKIMYSGMEINLMGLFEMAKHSSCPVEPNEDIDGTQQA